MKISWNIRQYREISVKSWNFDNLMKCWSFNQTPTNSLCERSPIHSVTPRTLEWNSSQASKPEFLWAYAILSIHLRSLVFMVMTAAYDTMEVASATLDVQTNALTMVWGSWSGNKISSTVYESERSLAEIFKTSEISQAVSELVSF